MWLWWDLPGPRAFLERILDDLRGGIQVYLQFPAFGPRRQDILLWLGRAWRDIAPLEVVTVVDDLDPRVVLARHFEVRPGQRLLPATFLASEAFCGRAIWLEGLKPANWPAWKAFFDEYARTARDTVLERRSMFVLPLEGALAAEEIAPQAGVSVHRWEDVVHPGDLLFLTLASRGRFRDPPGISTLAASIVSQLALYDFEIVERFAAAPTKQVLAPDPTLRDIARERGWSEGDPPCWLAGTGMRCEGRFRVHSALKVLNGGLRARLWRAQVAVIFPVIEECRQYLVRTLEKQVHLPFRTRWGDLIHDFRELEVNHLSKQVKHHQLRLGPRDRLLLERAVEVRNRLAHNDPVSSDVLLRLIELLPREIRPS